MGNGFIPGAVTPHIKLCLVPRVVGRVNVADIENEEKRRKPKKTDR